MKNKSLPHSLLCESTSKINKSVYSSNSDIFGRENKLHLSDEQINGSIKVPLLFEEKHKHAQPKGRQIQEWFFPPTFWETGRKRDMEISSSPWFTHQMATTDEELGQASTRNLKCNLSLQVGDRSSSTWVIISCLSGNTLVGSWTRNTQKTWIQTLHMVCCCPTWYFNCSAKYLPLKFWILSHCSYAQGPWVAAAKPVSLSTDTRFMETSFCVLSHLFSK